MLVSKSARKFEVGEEDDKRGMYLLMFIGPCIVIYYYSKTNEMHQFLKFILFCCSTIHVSDSLSIYNQESKTVHTASGLCQTDSAECLLAGKRWNWFQFHLVPTNKQSAESV
jgi:hypothetical protein